VISVEKLCLAMGLIAFAHLVNGIVYSALLV